MLKKHQKLAIARYRSIHSSLEQKRKEIDEEENQAFKKLIEELDEDERPPEGKTLGETLKGLFYSGKGKTSFCLTRASEVMGDPVAPERDCGTP